MMTSSGVFNVQPIRTPFSPEIPSDNKSPAASSVEDSDEVKELKAKVAELSKKLDGK